MIAFTRSGLMTRGGRHFASTDPCTEPLTRQLPLLAEDFLEVAIEGLSVKSAQREPPPERTPKAAREGRSTRIDPMKEALVVAALDELLGGLE